VRGGGAGAGPQDSMGAGGGAEYRLFYDPPPARAGGMRGRGVFAKVLANVSNACVLMHFSLNVFLNAFKLECI